MLLKTTLEPTAQLNQQRRRHSCRPLLQGGVLLQPFNDPPKPPGIVPTSTNKDNHSPNRSPAVPLALLVPAVVFAHFRLLSAQIGVGGAAAIAAVVSNAVGVIVALLMRSKDKNGNKD